MTIICSKKIVSWSDILIQQATLSARFPSLPHIASASPVIRNHPRRCMTPKQAEKVAVELSQQLVALDAVRTYLEHRQRVMLQWSRE